MVGKVGSCRCVDSLCRSARTARRTGIHEQPYSFTTGQLDCDLRPATIGTADGRMLRRHFVHSILVDDIGRGSSPYIMVTLRPNASRSELLAPFAARHSFVDDARFSRRPLVLPDVPRGA